MTIDLFIVLLCKPRLYVTGNAHLTTRMSTGGGVYLFHGLHSLRYIGTKISTGGFQARVRVVGFIIIPWLKYS